jgi:hypothetical protein
MPHEIGGLEGDDFSGNATKKISGRLSVNVIYHDANGEPVLNERGYYLCINTRSQRKCRKNTRSQRK